MLYTSETSSPSPISYSCFDSCARIQLLLNWVTRIGGGYVGFEVLTAVVMNSSIFWDITPCSPLKVNRRFGGTCRLHLQGWISQARNHRDAGSKQGLVLFTWPTSIISVWLLISSVRYLWLCHEANPWSTLLQLHPRHKKTTCEIPPPFCKRREMNH
jgi:hypothetical protein